MADGRRTEYCLAKGFCLVFSHGKSNLEPAFGVVQLVLCCLPAEGHNIKWGMM